MEESTRGVLLFVVHERPVTPDLNVTPRHGQYRCCPAILVGPAPGGTERRGAIPALQRLMPKQCHSARVPRLAGGNTSAERSDAAGAPGSDGLLDGGDSHRRPGCRGTAQG